jgi:hypothetical protein
MGMWYSGRVPRLVSLRQHQLFERTVAVHAPEIALAQVRAFPPACDPDNDTPRSALGCTGAASAPPSLREGLFVQPHLARRERACIAPLVAAVNL